MRMEDNTTENQLLLFKKILESNPEGVVITDKKGKIQWINKGFNKITGYELEEVLGKSTNILNSGVHDKGFYKDMWSQLIKQGKWSGEIWNRNKKGAIYSEWLNINKIQHNEKIHYVGIFKDLSEKKKIDRRMNDLQQKDLLTGLYNRNYFIELADSYIRDHNSRLDEFSIIFVNIENFKEINISLGHIIGDQLLITLSERLLKLMNQNYFVSRFDGDEFIILCKSITDEKIIRSFAETILKTIHEPFIIEGTIVHVDAVIGISRFPHDGRDIEDLIRYADIAMHRSKRQMENRICFYSQEMSQETENKFFVANHLVEAIANNELSIYYQPIFNIKDQEHIVALEALLRWNNPILGRVSPASFISLAEKTGQIITIGEWVLEEVCKQINKWKKKGYNTVPIAVNISVKQLEQMEFGKMVLSIMEKYNIDPKDIELEITESVSSGDTNIIVNNLKTLKEQGIRISMDDFGTGFSSLGQLDRFELDKLKIDKIFIDDLVGTSKRQSLVKSIIAMAESLDLTVVAEGIETDE